MVLFNFHMFVVLMKDHYKKEASTSSGDDDNDDDDEFLPLFFITPLILRSWSVPWSTWSTRWRTTGLLGLASGSLEHCRIPIIEIDALTRIGIVSTEHTAATYSSSFCSRCARRKYDTGKRWPWGRIQVFYGGARYSVLEHAALELTVVVELHMRDGVSDFMGLFRGLGAFLFVPTHRKLVRRRTWISISQGEGCPGSNSATYTRNDCSTMIPCIGRRCLRMPHCGSAGWPGSFRRIGSRLRMDRRR